LKSIRFGKQVWSLKIDPLLKHERASTRIGLDEARTRKRGCGNQLRRAAASSPAEWPPA
jgi:hypothetical protein